MTIQSNTSRVTYTGDNVSTAFPVPFLFFANTDITVVKTAVGGGVATLALNVDYTLTGAGVTSGGTLTKTTALLTGETLGIFLDPPRTQLSHYLTNDIFPAATLETNLDREVQISQRLYDLITRAIRAPDSDNNPQLTLPSAVTRALKYVAFDASGNISLSASLPSGTLSQASIGAFLYPQTTAEASASITPTNGWYPPGHVYRYKTNTTPGTTDMTTAFQNASLVSLNPYAPADTYLVTGTTQIRANQHWRFDRANINITGGLIVVFNVAEGINNWSMGGSLLITGDGLNDGSSGGGAVGLWITDSMYWRVEGFTAKNLKGWGILVSPGLNVVNRGETGNIVAAQAYACSVGIECQAGSGSEFVNLSSPQVARCGIGLKFGGGNVNATGGSSTVCGIGVYIDQGANSAHGIINGMNINHSTTYGVQINQVMNGQTFIGCHFYQNNIFIDRSKGILFEGGVIDCGVFNFKDVNSDVNVIRNMYCPGGYGFTRLAGSNNGHDQLIIENCFGPGIISIAGDALDLTGLSMNDAAPVHLFYRRDAASTQALTSGVAADLLFNNKIFDRRSVYNSGTGVFTVPAGRAGMYRIRATCLFGGTAMSSTASFVELKVNGVSTRIALTEIFSTTKLRCTIDEELYLSVADAVKLTATITGTTPSFGDPTWQSYFSVEKIA